MPDEAMLALERAHTVLVVDWRSTDVPDTLVRAGCAVVVKGAPNRIATRVRELNRGEVVSRKLTDPPQSAGLFYVDDRYIADVVRQVRRG